MKATKQIDIYLTGKRNVRVIDVVQYDTGIQLVFTVKDFTIPSGVNATLYVQKPSGKFVYQEDGITVSGNVVTVDLHNQAITEHGKVPYQVSITSGSDVITTFTGLMMVEKSLKDAGATESKTVIRAFDEAVSDHVAEFQTKAEQIVQACIATIPDDYSTMEAKVNELANAVKGYLSGAVVAADDVSPVEHSPAVRVHGKNLFNYDAWKGVNAIHGEVTYSDDGVVKLTATENDCFTNYGMYPVAARIPVKAGETVTLSWETDAVETLTSGLNYIFMNGAADNFKSAPATQKKITYIAPADCEFITFRLGVSVAGDSITYWNIQVEKGDTATEYTPYIDPTTVTVSRCGRNLIPKLNEPINVQAAGITQAVSTNGTVKIYGTATDPAYLFISAIYNLPKAVYYLTGNTSDECFLIASAYNGDAYVFEAQDRGQGVILDLTDKTFDHVRVMMYVPAGNTVGKTIYPILSIDQAVKGYEAPKSVTTHIPSADGTVSGMTSISPNMTILTDTEGVIVECEYNRDTNKVIDKLINAITALGGTV